MSSPSSVETETASIVQLTTPENSFRALALVSRFHDATHDAVYNWTKSTLSGALFIIFGRLKCILRMSATLAKLDGGLGGEFIISGWRNGFSED